MGWVVGDCWLVEQGSGGRTIECVSVLHLAGLLKSCIESVGLCILFYDYYVLHGHII